MNEDSTYIMETETLKLTPTQRAAMAFFGDRDHRFANDFPCSRSVLYKLRDAGLIEMRAHHRETIVGITPAGRAAVSS